MDFRKAFVNAYTEHFNEKIRRKSRKCIILKFFYLWGSSINNNVLYKRFLFGWDHYGDTSYISFLLVAIFVLSSKKVFKQWDETIHLNRLQAVEETMRRKR